MDSRNGIPRLNGCTHTSNQLWQRSRRQVVKSIRMIATFVCAISMVHIAIAQGKQAPFDLVISTDNSTVAAGSDVFILETMKNTSNRPIDCTGNIEGNLDVSFDYDVHGEDGKSVRKPDVNPKDFPGNTSFCTLDPGESASGHLWISWLYDFTKPGKYFIQIARRVENGSAERVKSNVLTITVVK